MFRTEGISAIVKSPYFCRKSLIVSNIELLLNYCLRFYDRQFITREEINNSVVKKFMGMLDEYIAGIAESEGLPSVGYFADKCCYSPKYFGELVKTETGRTVNAQSLTERQKHLGTIAALEAQGDLERLAPAIKDALDTGLTANEIKEAFSQLYAYTGFPRSLNALGILSKVLENGNPAWNEGREWVRPVEWATALSR